MPIFKEILSILSKTILFFKKCIISCFGYVDVQMIYKVNINKKWEVGKC